MVKLVFKEPFNHRSGLKSHLVEATMMLVWKAKTAGMAGCSLDFLLVLLRSVHITYLI